MYIYSRSISSLRLSYSCVMTSEYNISLLVLVHEISSSGRVLLTLSCSCHLQAHFLLAMQQSSGTNLRSVGVVTRASLAFDTDERNKHFQFAARTLNECKRQLASDNLSTCRVEERVRVNHMALCGPSERLSSLFTTSQIFGVQVRVHAAARCADRLHGEPKGAPICLLIRLF